VPGICINSEPERTMIHGGGKRNLQERNCDLES